MSTSDPHKDPHPHELLDAYVLDALDEAEAIQVESHLDSCPQCRSAVSELHRTVAHLGQSVGRREAPDALRLRLMEALEPTGAGATPMQDVSRPGGAKAPVVRVLMLVAAAVVVALFTLAVFMNLRLSDRMEGLRRENSTLTAQVAQSTNEDTRVAETLNQLQLTSWWLVNPANRSLTLKSPTGAGESRGILLVADDGHRAVLMLVGMARRSPSSRYQVWLLRYGDRVLAGEVQVNDGGWGAATLQPKESLFRFDRVELTTKMVSGVGPSPEDMVLEGNISTSEPSRMLVLQQWP